MKIINFRKQVYFLLDELRGSAVKKELSDMIKMRESGDNSRELATILQYAQKNIPYYHHIQICDLSHFPVMSKETYNANMEYVRNPAFPEESLHITSTSGSTSVPFKTYQDKQKRNRTIADLMTLFAQFNFDVGERYVFIRSWVAHYNNSGLRKLKQNYIAVDVNTFDQAAKEMLRQKLKKDKKIKAVISYASALADFVSYLEKQNDSADMFNMSVIFSCADTLTPDVKARVEHMFGCPVINRYSNEECGILGYTPIGSTCFCLNTASYYFELLKLEADVPADPGEVGRIVVTDLFNKAMPLIRYDLGDLGVSEDSGERVTMLSSLQGRASDAIISDRGILITPAILSAFMMEYKYIDKYQLILTKENEIKLRVVTETENLQELQRQLSQLFGTKRTVQIERTDYIPNEKNGKFKQIVNLLGDSI